MARATRPHDDVPNAPDVETVDDDEAEELVAPGHRTDDEDGSAAAEFVDLDMRRRLPARRERLAPAARPLSELVADTTVARYFHDLAGHPTFPDAASEMAAAREVERAELDHWLTLLSYVPAAEPILVTLQRHLATAEPGDVAIPVSKIPPLLALAQDANRRDQGRVPADRQRAWADLAVDLGAALRIPDNDRVWMTAAGTTARALLSPAGAAPSTMPATSTTRRYLAAIETTHATATRAKERFVRANLRLVVSIARRYNRGRLPLIDLIQEGNLGLIKAVERFDAARGYRFSTYSSWWIRHAISRSIADKGRAVRVPVHMLDTYNRSTRARQSLVAKLGREPTLEELHDESGLPVEKLARVKDFHAETPISLDRPIGDDDGRKFLDLLADETAPSAFDRLAAERWALQAEGLLSELPTMEQRILRARFGIGADGGDEDELTLRELGEEYGITRERIRQIEAAALTKLRDRAEILGYGDG